MTTPPPYPAQPYPPAVSQSGPHAEPPLWMPHYGCSLPKAVSRFVRKYATFSGRASRAEFWWLFLAYTVTWLALAFLAFLAGLPGSTTDVNGELEPGPGFIPFAILLFVVALGSIVPSLALTVRRLHDANLSGLFLLINFIPYIGGLVLFVLTLLPPKPEGARFDRPVA